MTLVNSETITRRIREKEALLHDLTAAGHDVSVDHGSWEVGDNEVTVTGPRHAEKDVLDIVAKVIPGATYEKTSVPGGAVNLDGGLLPDPSPHTAPRLTWHFLRA